MTPTDNKAKLVKRFYYVCNMCEKELNCVCQRFSISKWPDVS